MVLRTTQSHNPEYFDLNLHGHQNLKSRKGKGKVAPVLSLSTTP
jgi:hypothetical protein